MEKSKYFKILNLQKELQREIVYLREMLEDTRRLVQVISIKEKCTREVKKTLLRKKLFLMEDIDEDNTEYFET